MIAIFFNRTFVSLFILGAVAGCSGASTGSTKSDTSPTSDEPSSDPPASDTPPSSTGKTPAPPPPPSSTSTSPPPPPPPPPPIKGKRIFLSSLEYGGDLKTAGSAANGLAGADAICNLLAQASGVTGTWTAWVSDTSTRAVDRIVGAGPWVRMDGQQAFLNRANLQTTSSVAIDLDEKSQSWASEYIHGAWTGTSLGGMASTSRCLDWTSSSSLDNGTVGDILSGLRWTADALDSCSYPHHLYCFEN